MLTWPANVALETHRVTHVTANISSAPGQNAIHLNGARTDTAAATLAELLVEQGYANVKVATAVNGTFIPERERAARRLAAGDAIEVVSARQGG